MNQQENDFLFKDTQEVSTQSEKWKVLIVDDDADIHDVTKFVLKDFEFRNKKLQFISAFSIEEAKKIMKEHPDIALILLDIVMEEEDSGLKLVKYLRETLKNQIVRIILRTGQPGVAPQTKVVIDYDINDYKEKTELTKDKLFYTIVMALRSFEILKSFQQSVNYFETSFLSAERFISKDYLAVLGKKSITDIKIGDFVKREMTVLFIDMSTIFNIDNNAPTKETMQLINDYMNHLEQLIKKNNGFINNIIGCTIIALFDNPSDNAINTSIDFIKFLQSLQHEHNLKVRIGIQTGFLTLGVIGNENQINYVALGETIDLAAQLLENNKLFHTQILIGDNGIKNLNYPESFAFRWIGNLPNDDNTKNKLLMYEIFDIDQDAIKQLKQQTTTLFESAVNHYIESYLEEAMEEFSKVLDLNPQDKIAKSYLSLLNDKSK